MARDAARRRGEAAPADEPGPDRPVARAELLPPQLARPDPRIRQRPGQAEPVRPDRRRIASWPAAASGCGSSARRSSSTLGGKKIHPAWSVPGGVRGAAHARRPRRICAPDAGGAGHRAGRPRPVQGAARSLSRGGRHRSAISRRCSSGWSRPDGTWEHYDGAIRVGDATGSIVADGLDAQRYSRVHRRGDSARLVPEVPLLQAARLSGRHLPRRPAGAAQHLRPHADAAGRPRAARVSRPVRHRDAHRSSSTTPG